MRRLAAMALGICLSLGSTQALALSETEIPKLLRDWVPWVLDGHEEIACPAVHDKADRRLCAWPGSLDLALDDKGGKFAQAWRVYAKGWVALPGDAKQWPRDIRINGEPAVVMNRKGVPSVRLAPGRHRVEGAFTWRGLPQSLRLPKALGLLSLAVNGQPVAFPDLDDAGKLWLGKRRTTSVIDTVEDALSVQVFRHIEDDLPMRVTTRIRLDVSGRNREIIIGPGLLPGFIPVALKAPLPARLEAAGKIRAQVRPGSWTIDLVARHPGPVGGLTRPPGVAPWPKTEVWVFKAHDALRLVEVDGVPAVDPTQTTLPKEWQRLPAYSVSVGERLNFTTKRRGDPEPAPDQLRLQRTLWLDFDGEGYTARDRFTGTISSGWRLEMTPPFALGRASVDGKDQLITRAEESGKVGVALRRGRLDLIADSRLDADSRALSAVGWDRDVRSLSVRLNVPPGWRVFNASGPDSVSATWVQRWSMLDLFLVLIIALAVGRLWNWQWGVLALATLILIYHEPGAPRWVWLHVLGAAGLFSVMPLGRLRKLVGWYRNGALLALALIVLPFVVAEVRTVLYPQLEITRYGSASSLLTGGLFDEVSNEMSSGAIDSGSLLREAVPRSSRKRLEGRKKARPSSPIMQFDPAAKIQTGPGVPSWRQRTVVMHWNGPVERGETIGLIMVSPLMNSVLGFIGVLLTGVLTLLMLASRFEIPIRFMPSAAVLVAVVLASQFHAAPATAAEIPDSKLLETLRERLLKTPDCFPDCAEIPALDLDIKANGMTARMDVHASEQVAVPLPGDDRFWRLRRVLLDGMPAEALRLDNRRRLWLQVSKGRHVVEMEGVLADGVTLPIPLAVRPRRVTWRAENGWRLDGLDKNGVPGAQLHLTRLRQRAHAPGKSLEPSRMPPFAQVERTLTLGLEWRVKTRVVRDRASGGAIVLEVPLLAGESVTSENTRVQNGKVRINMTPGQRESGWSSTLAIRPELLLTAPGGAGWVESWRLAASPVWHVVGEGLAPIFRQNSAGEWQPVWRPWPGESLNLHVSRPSAVEGRTLTIDRSALKVRPGQRSSEATLTLRLRSSQGGQHVLRLPRGIRVDAVTIDGRRHPVRERDGELTLTVTPGEHKVVLQWREARAISVRFAAPSVQLRVPSVNSETVISVPRDRWVLFADGPRQGPAVLFWGVLIVVLAIAWGLGRTTVTPLRFLSWALLGVGLTQVPVLLALLIVGWLFAFAARARLSETTGKTLFNLIQIGMTMLTLVALSGLAYAVYNGLLGTPEMQVRGNGSSEYFLRWYQDRVEDALPATQVFSVSIWFYRVLMLAWALWLAVALLDWLRWGWQCFSANGLWRPFRLLWWRRPQSMY